MLVPPWFHHHHHPLWAQSSRRGSKIRKRKERRCRQFGDGAIVCSMRKCDCRSADKKDLMATLSFSQLEFEMVYARWSRYN